ncbi:MAG TPA: hypothetical protein VMZ27_04010, partial [Candidatus Saccharimonadales bacterium]|nr:hypothetical protein [Candidatus Saccharimonadales bacterium]
MTANRTLQIAFCALGVVIFAVGAGAAESDLEKQLQSLKESNEALRQQLQKQEKTIDELSKKVSAISNETTNESTPAKVRNDEADLTSKPLGFHLGRVRFTGEGGAGFFRSGPDGVYPNSEFRIDEAKLFVEAPLWNETYFFGELNLTQREDPTESLSMGELYIDFENV